MKLIVSILFIVLTFAQCKPKPKSIIGEDAIARVQDNYLFKEDVEKVMPENISGNDSLLFLNDFIDNWLKEELILNKAKKNLSAEQRNFSEQLETYENSLIKYEYEKYLIQQYLDTVVAEEEITEYYENNRSIFRLSENIVNVRYILLSVDSLYSREAKRRIRAKEEEDFVELEEFCKKYASDYAIDKRWVPLELLLENTPLEVENQDFFLKMNKNVFLKDSLYQYIIYIDEYKLKNDISPLCFEEKTIINLILNKRKLKIVKEMKKDVFRQAQIKNEFTVY